MKLCKLNIIAGKGRTIDICVKIILIVVYIIIQGGSFIKENSLFQKQ